MKKNIKLVISVIFLLIVMAIPTGVVFAGSPSLGGQNGGGSNAGGGGVCLDSTNCVRGWGTRVTLLYYDFNGTGDFTPIKSYVISRSVGTLSGLPGPSGNGYISNGQAQLPAWSASKLTSGHLQVFEGKVPLNGVWYAGVITSTDTNAVNPYSQGAAYAAWVENLTNGIFSATQPQGLKQPGGRTPANGRPTAEDLAWKFGLTVWRGNGTFNMYQHINSREYGKYYIAVEPIYETYKNPHTKTVEVHEPLPYTYQDGTKNSYCCGGACGLSSTGSTYRNCAPHLKDIKKVPNMVNTDCSKRFDAAYCMREPNSTELKNSSGLRTARSGGQKNYIRSISNPKGGTENRYCNAAGGNCKYYVGPNERTALVKSGGVYELITAADRSKATKATTPGVAVGVAFYYLKGNCRDECYGKTGTDRLKCAEKFCDGYEYDPNKPYDKESCVKECMDVEGQRCKAMFRPQQKEDIRAYCKLFWKDDKAGYKSEEECFNDCSCEDCGSTSCTDYDPYKDDPTKPNIDQKTSCGTVEGGYKTCDTSDYTHPVIERRKYYTVSCVEKSKFDFRDTSKELLVPGEGLYYDVNLDGNKMCRVYFDVKAWELDYASIHSKDPSASQKLAAMRKHYEDFNKAFAPKNANGGYGDIATFTSILGFNDYNLKKVEVNAQFNEVINRPPVQNVLSKVYYLLMENQARREDTIANLKTEKIELINSHSSAQSGTKLVNHYQTASVRSGHYQMPGQCLTHDGNANVYEPTGERCDDGTEPQKVYYTSLLAMTINKLPAGMRHEVIANASTKYDEGGNTYYTSSRDVCTFNFKCEGDDCPPYDGGKCTITVKSGQRVPGVENGYTGPVELELGIVDLPDTANGKPVIIAAGMDTTQLFDPTTIEWLKTVLDTSNSCSNKPVMVYGKIKTDTGDIECELPLNFIGDCGNNLWCEIEPVKKNLYRIAAKGSLASSAQYFYSIRGGTPIQIQPDANNNGFYISTNESATSIVGIVKSGGNTAYCSAGGRCTDYFQPTETNAISKYCQSNWKTDLAGYTSANDCENRCANDCTNPDGCPNGALSRRCVDRFKKDEVKEIKDYCLANWSKDLGGYKSAEDCINGCTSTKAVCSVIKDRTYAGIAEACKTNDLLGYFGSSQNCASICCEDTGVCSGSRDYVYRPVNSNNPFPDSYLDQDSLNKNRPIGGNWYGRQDNITKTSEVVAQKGNEYVIKLNADTIRAIRQDNANYNKNNEGNVYVDYIYSKEAADRLKSGEKGNVVYESKFIHNNGDGGFNKIFTIIDREANNQ